MARRTTVEKVQEAIGGHYGPVNGVVQPLGPFIDKANAVVNQVQFNISKVTVVIQPTLVDYELMERWTACYMYSLNDPRYTQRSTSGASGSFAKEKLGENYFYVQAVQSDPSGLLKALLDRAVAVTVWVGTPAQDQLAWWQR
jgi:hypothetical protein